MSFEFAVDPTCIDTWRSCQFVLSNFGSEHGRLIAKFPKTWIQLVMQACKNEKPLARHRIIERMNSAFDKFSLKTRQGHADLETWLQASLHEHKLSPFQAIITPSPCNQAQQDYVVDFEMLEYDKSVNNKWKVLPCVQGKTFGVDEPRDFIQACPFIAMASLSKIRIVDKYMFYDHRSTVSLKMILQMFSRCWTSAPRILELCYGPENADVSKTEMESNARTFVISLKDDSNLRDIEVKRAYCHGRDSYERRDPHERWISLLGKIGTAQTEKVCHVSLTGGVDRLVDSRFEISVFSRIY